MNVRKFPWRLISNEIFYDTSFLLQVFNSAVSFRFIMDTFFTVHFTTNFLLRFSASFRCELLCKGKKKAKQGKHLSQKWFVHSSAMHSSISEAHTHQVLKKMCVKFFILIVLCACSRVIIKPHKGFAKSFAHTKTRMEKTEAKSLFSTNKLFALVVASQLAMLYGR